MNKQIAETTLMQLGGYGRLKAMIGAEFFSYDDKGTLTFKFKGCRKANYLEVVLDADDTYTMVFLKITNPTRKEVGKFSGLYCDQLQGIFENETGLYLSL